MENDGFFMNVNTNVSASALKKNSAASKKQEKKNKYTEKKLLNKKRQRDPSDIKNKTSDSENKQNEGNGKNTNQTNNYAKKNFLDYNNQQMNFKNKASLGNNANATDEGNKNEAKKPLNEHNKFETNKNRNSNNINYANKNKDNTAESQHQTQTLDLNESPEMDKNKESQNSAKILNQNLDDYKFKEEPNNDLMEELNEFYSQQDKEQASKPKRLTSKEKHINKQKVKTMQSEIENEIKEINEQAQLDEEAKEKAKETPIDYNSSVFSLKDFQDLDISPYLKRVLKKENLSIMTKVQKKSIPILLKHRDVVVKSETGSGKTLAYVIPVYDFLINLNIKNKIQRKDGVYAVIFAPTHELCLQIEATFDKMKSCCIGAVFGSLMGGQSIETEKSRLRKGLNVIITTPGRMLYHLNNTSTLNFSNLKMFVFDEADILLNMGFEKDIKDCMRLIINKYNTSVPENLRVKVLSSGKDKDAKKMLDGEDEAVNYIVEKSEDLNSEYFKKFKIFLISATIDNKIRKMADFLMKGFKSVGFEIKKDDNKNKKSNNNSNINENNKGDLNNEDQKMMEIIEEDDNETFNAPANLVQEYSIVFDEFRLIHLLCQIYNNFNKKLIVFVSCCDTVNFLQEFLSNFEFNLEHIIHEGEVGVGFNKYRNKEDSNAPNKNTKKNFKGKNPTKGDNEGNKEGGSNEDKSDPEKRIKLINNPILKLHGKMTHEERKKIFKEFNQDKPAILICTDVASRGLDFPHVDLIIHYDVNPDPKEYLNRMGRTARLDKSGNSLLFLMKHEEKVLHNSLRKFTINNSKPGSILLNFVENFNDHLASKGFKEKISTVPQAYKDEVDENEKYRKKYIFAIFPLQKSIKDYLFQNRDNLVNARKAFKSSIRSYVTFLKFQKDVFNVKALNLSRFARSFCLYKETSTVKVGNKSVMIDYETEKKNTKGNKKFNNKKIEKRLLISEFS